MQSCPTDPEACLPACLPAPPACCLPLAHPPACCLLCAACLLPSLHPMSHLPAPGRCCWSPSVTFPPLALCCVPAGVEFEKGWKGLKGNRQQQAAYLLALQPAALPALLKQALTPGLLAAAAAALLRPGLAEQPAAAVALLSALPQVPRFDLNLLSVPPRQRAELRQEWDAGAAALAGGAAAAGEGGDATQLAEQLAAARQRWKL